MPAGRSAKPNPFDVTNLLRDGSSPKMADFRIEVFDLPPKAPSFGRNPRARLVDTLAGHAIHHDNVNPAVVVVNSLLEVSLALVIACRIPSVD